MNIWCCAALALGGGDPLPDLPLPTTAPVLEAKPLTGTIVREEKPCADCGGSVKPRPPVAVQRTSKIPISEPTLPQTTVVESTGPVAVELPQRRMAPTYVPMSPAEMYPDQGGQRYRAQAVQHYPSYSYTAAPAAPKTPWYKRWFGGSRATSPSMTPMPSEPTLMSAPMGSGIPATAGRVLQRETWRTQPTTMAPRQEMQVVETAMPPQPSPTAAMEMPQQQPVQSAAKQAYVARKPIPKSTSMMRDASVWQYSGSRDSTPATNAPKDAQKPTMVDLPEAPPQAPEPATAALPSWADDVIAKTIEHNVKATPIAAPTVEKKTQGAPVAAPKAEGQMIFGRVSKTYAGGGGWMLKADDGRDYFLKGDESVLRFRHGDDVEVTGVVTPSGVLGVSSIQVEKVSFSVKH